jgi:hypothetical protein
MRRAIFLLMGLAIFIPIVIPMNFPIIVTKPVRDIYQSIDRLPRGSVLFISFDFDPASKPELYPMGIAIMRHAFRKGLRVIAMGLWLPGKGLAEEILTKTAKEYEKEYGKDYVFLGWLPQPQAVITNLGEDILKTFPKDYRGNDVSKMEVIRGIKSLRDVDYMVCLAAGDPGIETWIIYGADKYKFKMGGGCTGVIAPGIRPYYQTGQLTGLIGAMRGAAEYETLLGIPGSATESMGPLSIGHFLIILLIILGNIIYFARRR